MKTFSHFIMLGYSWWLSVTNNASPVDYYPTTVTELWAAIASDVGGMLLVTLNAMLLLPKRQTGADVAVMKGDVEDGKFRHSNVGLVRDGGTDCESLDEAERKRPSPSACSKSCCSSIVAQKPSCCNSLVQEERPLAAMEEKACATGCCSDSSIATRKDECDKGCHDAPKHERTSPAETKACSKGCCGSTEAKIDDHGDHEHDHLH